VGGCRAGFSCRHTPIGMMRPRKKFISTFDKGNKPADSVLLLNRIKYQFGGELSACGLRCMLFLLFTLVPDEPRDYDELAEDEDAHPGGTSSLDVNMEDAHAILNEEDTEPGNLFPPPAPPSHQGGKSEFPRILHATISSIKSTPSGVALYPPHHHHPTTPPAALQRPRG
jgi:hypothetical protein